MAISRDYPPEVVDKALELAAAIGIRPAGARLEIHEATIRGWTKHPEAVERYAELRRHNAPKWRERAAATMEELVDGYAAIEVAALEKAAAALDDLEARDVGNFLRSIAVAKGVTADHVAKLRGQPSQVVEHRVSAGELESAMEQLRREAIDSTAEEILELPEETTRNHYGSNQGQFAQTNPEPR